VLITSLRDLKQVIKALREGGVTSAEIDGVKLTLLPKSISNEKKRIDYSSDIPEANIPVPKFTPIYTETVGNGGASSDAPLIADKIESEELTEEQLLMWSAAGHEQ